MPVQKASRGYFAVGVEGVSKPMNLGAILRTAHAFGASFAFTIDAQHDTRDVLRSDTSKASEHMPCFDWPSLDALVLPKGCALVGVELTEDAIDLPSFRHPSAAAYVFGREKGSLMPPLLSLCDHVVAIPTRFCVNVGLAVAITLYDRTLVMGGWPERPVRPGGPKIGPPEGWKRPGRSNG